MTGETRAPGEARTRSAREAVRARAQSFRHAFAGVGHMLGEPNFRIQVAIGVVVIVGGALLRVPPGELVALILVSIAVLVMETLNTVIEAVVDVSSPDYHPRARVAKDAAAGGVLLTSLAAVVVGIYVFGPPILRILGR